MGISVEEYKELVRKQNGKANRGKEVHDPKRQLQGKINRELGKVFEDTVYTICQVYEYNGLAKIEKTPEPMKILKYIDGGRFENVICSDANAIVLINKDDINKAKSIINKIDTNLKDEYKLTDCNIKVDLVECEESKSEKSPIKNESTDNFINAIISLPQGLIEVSQEFINLPWTSLNLGVIETKDDRIIFITFIRSNNDIKRQKLVEKYKIIINKFNGKCNVSGEYPAWQYNKDSMLKNDMIKLYSELYSKDLEVVATHGGLECGILIDKIKGLDAVSVGPLLKNVHSVDETLYVDTVKKVFDFLYKFLKKRA